MEEYGTTFVQREPITRRIRNLLKDYPDGLSVPKELIQNADDARASRTQLIFDQRSHPSDDPSVRKLSDFMGPALLFCNDQQFRPADFDNLCEFGGATKLEDRKKVGKFGLGFNSVYNITDLPMFVSGEYLCILDPHEKFLEGKGKFKLTEQKEGKKMCCEMLADLLKPFEGIFGFRLQNLMEGKSFNGTIFRFPLRTETHMQWSEIGKAPYSHAEVEKLFEMTANARSLLLLFTQFVSSFSMDIISPDSTWTNVISLDRSFPDDGLSSVQNPSQVLFGDQDRFSYNYSVCISDRKENEDKVNDWFIFVNAHGSRSHDNTRAVGAIAVPKDLNLARLTNYRVLCCFLPIPQPGDTKLPFLINGTFAITSSRRSLEVKTMDDKSDDGVWNNKVLCDAAAPALVKAVTHFSQNPNLDLSQIFPSEDAINECVVLFVHRFFHLLCTNPEAKFIASSSGNVAICDSSLKLFDRNIPLEISKVLLQLLPGFNHRFKWALIDEKILSKLMFYSPDHIKPKFSTFRFCLELFLNNLYSAIQNNFHESLQIIKYALKCSQNDSDIAALLRQKAFLLKNSSAPQLCLPSDLVNPHGPAAKVLAFTSEFFPAHSMNLTQQDLAICEKLGMYSKSLPGAAIKAVKRNLYQIADYDAAVDVFKVLVSHLDNCGSFYTQHGDIWSDILLPVKQSELYPFDKRHLVEYVSKIQNFSSIGIERNSFLDKKLILYSKNPQVQVVLSSLSQLVSDYGKNFLEKTDDIEKIFDFFSSCDVKSLAKGFVYQNSVIPTSQAGVFKKLPDVCLDSCRLIDDVLFSVHHKLRNSTKANAFLKRSGMASVFGSDTYVDKINSLKSVTSSQVHQVRDILEDIRRKSLRPMMNLPDTQGVMRGTENLCMNDSDFFDLPPTSASITYFYCHPDIPVALGLYFGAKRKQALNLQLHTTFFKPFGQHEKLTSRLNRICNDGYSNDMDIFKEMVQNAEDAGATEIAFILDSRNLKTNETKVLDQNWTKLLKPSLLVLNDAPFSTKDIEGIQKLGEGSKGDNLESIGQFGVGFNCTYRLTDTPSFLTQVDKKGLGSICLLDPTKQILSDIGCQVDLTEKLISDFPDSINCYLNDHFQVTRGKTMFRLPLRSGRGSALSDYTPELNSMEEKLMSFLTLSKNFILFLKNITNISVYKVSNQPAGYLYSSNSSLKIEEVGKVSKEIHSENFSLFRQNFNSNIHRFNSSPGFSGCVYLASVKHSHRRNSNSLYERVSGEKEKTDKNSEWLVSEQVGSDCPYNLGQTRRMRKHGVVALPRENLEDFQAAVSCYLAVDESSSILSSDVIKLPVLINGHFHLEESRRNISLGNNTAGGQWNRFLLTKIIGAAYANLIQHIADNTESLLYDENPKYWLNFPSSKQSSFSDSSLAFLLSKGLYLALRNRQGKFIPHFSFNKDFVAFENLQNVLNFWDRSHPSAPSVAEVCENVGLKLAQLPETFTNVLYSCEIGEASVLKPDHIFPFLCEQIESEAHVSDTPYKTEANCINFLIWSKSFLKSALNAKTLPIYLSANLYIYRNNSENKLYSSLYKVSRIFPDLGRRILHHRVENILQEFPDLTCHMTESDFIQNFEHFCPRFCRNNIISGLDCKDDELLSWCQLIWKFVLQQPNPLSMLGSMGTFSLLPCRDLLGSLWCLPICEGRRIVFSENFSVPVGHSFSIYPLKYPCFYQLDSRMSELFLYQECRRFGKVPKFLDALVFTKSSLLVDNILSILSSLNELGEKTDVFKKASLIFAYLEQSLQSDLTPHQVDIIRHLPIHCTVNGNYRALHGLQVYSVDPRVPRVGLEYAENERSAQIYVWKSIYEDEFKFQETLGVIHQSPAQVYIEFIIPLKFPGSVFPFTENSLKMHLKFLYDSYIKFQPYGFSNIESNLPISFAEFNSIFAQMRLSMRVEPELSKQNSSGDLLPIEDLYDPSVPLFCQFKRDKLLPNLFYPYLKLFQAAGIRTNIREPEFWGFSTEFSSRCLDKHNDETFNTLSQLIEAFCLLNLSSFIKFAKFPIWESTDSDFALLLDLYSSEHQPLVSHVAKTMSPRLWRKISNNSRFLNFWRLTPNNHPSADLILANLEKITQSVDKHELYEKVKPIIKHIAVNGDSSSRNRLAAIPCVLTKEEHLLPPRHLCMSTKETDSLPGLQLYIGCPNEDFDAIWKDLSSLGATRELSLQQLVYTLKVFSTEFACNASNPNKLELARSLNDFFFEFLSSSKTVHLREDEPVYLLTMDMTFVNTKSSIFQDLHLKQWTRFRDQFKSSCADSWRNLKTYLLLGTLFCNPNIFDRLPLALRPGMLSDKLKSGVTDLTLDPSNELSDFPIDIVMANLKLDQFTKKLAVILNCNRNDEVIHNMTSSSSVVREVRYLTLTSFQDFSKFHLKPVKLLSTFAEIEIENEKLSFESIEEVYRLPDSNTIYFKNEPNAHSNVVTHLLRACSVFPFYYKDIGIKHVAEFIFKCFDPSSQAVFLRENNYELTLADEDDKFKPGDFVPYREIAMVQHDPFVKHQVNSWVALLVKEDEGVQTFMYAQVHKVVKESDLTADPIFLGLYQIKIKHGKIIEVNGEDLFSFQEQNLQNDPVDNQAQIHDKDLNDDIKKIISALELASGSAETLDKFQTRLIRSILSKYTSEGDHQNLIEAVQRMIREKKEQQISEEPTDHAERGVGDSMGGSQGSGNSNGALDEQMVCNYISNQFHRQTRQIAAHKEFHKRYPSYQQRSSSTYGYRSHSSGSSHYASSIELPYLVKFHTKEKHPGKAMVWLKNSSNDLQVLEYLKASQTSFPEIICSTSLKVIQGVLAGLAFMKDGDSMLPFDTPNSHALLKNQISDLLEKVPDDIPDEIRSETVSVGQLIGDVDLLCADTDRIITARDIVEVSTAERTAVVAQRVHELASKYLKDTL